MQIGFFDSGLGGLLVLKSVAQALPDYDYVFYGDTEHLPYGDKTEKEIFEYTKAAVTELFKRDCSLVIIACNTASAETLRKLQDTFLFNEYPDRKILGVIIPAVEALIDSMSKQSILLATKRTIDSDKYTKELDKRTVQHTKLHSIAAPELVPLIELGEIDEALGVAQYLVGQKIQEVGEIDTVVLGCTHYARLTKGLREHFGDSIQFITQDEIIPEKLRIYLENHSEITEKLSNTGKRSIVLTQHRADYDRMAADLLGGSFIEK